MQLFLQIVGGLFYLLNKICFAVTERSSREYKKRKWRITSWVFYLIGLPFILALFWMKSNWMAFAVEAAGSVGMVYGLAAAYWGLKDAPKWLEKLAIAAAVGGIVFSVFTIGWFEGWAQRFELGTTIGFLMGTIMAGKQKASGYAWYMFMNATTCGLCLVQGWWVLAGQQVISFFVMWDAWNNKRKPAIKNILITGAPGVGKSTIVQELISTLHGNLGGFYTEELRPGGENFPRKGFVLHPLGIRSAHWILAHVDPSGTRNAKHGRYHVSTSVMRDFAIPALDIGLERGKVLVIDEVGFMQLTSTEFPFAVLRAFESECPVIATIPTASHPFVDALRKRDDVHIYTVTHGNRDALREVLRERVRAWVD